MNEAIGWIPLSRIDQFLTVEPAIVLSLFFIGAWLTYKIFLRNVLPHRKTRLNGLFSNLNYYYLLFILSFVLYTYFRSIAQNTYALSRFFSYLGVISLILGMITFVRTARIAAFEYLFLTHMKEGVPALLVNIFTLSLYIVGSGYIATEIFNFKLAPLLATSAFLSVILGLALQDTLGQLFAGLALQFDKPFEIGDWIEVHTPSGKKSGQVLEITWRATLLVAMGDETIIVPNRLISQSEISNFSAKQRPFVRTLTFRINYETDRDRAKLALIEATLSVGGVSREPSPVVFTIDTTESWVTLRLVYFITQYGSQFSINDRVLDACLESLDRVQVKLANQKIQVMKDLIA